MTTVLAAALLAGGIAVTAAPAQAAPAKASAASGVITCEPAKLRQDAAQLDRKADELNALGERDAAAKAHRDAEDLRRHAKACEDAENNS
ncbi:hypothetical protein [Streptomyces sp. CBMA152]|uniref:hypothetical protein n=1 Tax=Streptomyces sp. CBMA152 TaxID=1896312 RepID=UPI001660764A|nr:hypothetical protein [Streptomyces sp. CBMA152]